MRVDPGGLYPSRPAAETRSDAHSGSETDCVRQAAGDQVSVSPRARLIALARQALDEAPVVRQDAVEAARQRLQAGTESWDGRSIAGAIFNAISDDAA